jgi:peptidoglycan/LPS O-acetylase OafA/YrhL
VRQEQRAEHRPDVDGLRAIAVLSVILFHVDKDLLPGGFVGVDIFFVISGFLITRNILTGLSTGQFSLIEFYRRRVKRIAPPLLVVVAVTVLVANLLMLPENAEATAESAAWSLGSLANVYFWLHQDTGYFAAASSDSPLLHLWSLGVEEQYYFIWPLCLLLAYRARAAWRGWFVALAALGCIASYALGQLIFAQSPSFAYYMLPTRAGELLLGGLVAVGIVHGIERRIPHRLALPIAIAGLLLVFGSFAFIKEDKVFPGVLAILPTLGGALLILAGYCRDNVVSRMLSTRPMVWIGLVSYSAYLWHWPLLSFLRYGNVHVGPALGVGVVAVTLLLAWLTYRLLETPTRASEAPALQIFVRQFAAPACVIVALSLAAMRADGYGLRSPEYRERLAQLRNVTRPAYSYEYICQRHRVTRADSEDQRCVLGSGPSALLWGDSNAAHYVGMVGAFAQAGGFSFRNLASGSCPPVFADPALFVPARRVDGCRAAVEVARETISNYPVVLISGIWTAYEENSSQFLSAVFDTVRTIAAEGKLVIIIGQVPPATGYDRRCREKTLAYPMLTCVALPVAPSAAVLGINARLRAFADNEQGVEYFDAVDYLCNKGRGCSVFDAGAPLYYDLHHLSVAGSWKLGHRILSDDGVPSPFLMIAKWQVGRR